MSFNKSFTISLCLVLLLSFAAVAQAAPPLQTGTTGGTANDSLNLDENGDPIENVEATPEHQNLGEIMSGADKTTTDETVTPEASATTPTMVPTPLQRAHRPMVHRPRRPMVHLFQR